MEEIAVLPDILGPVPERTMEEPSVTVDVYRLKRWHQITAAASPSAVADTTHRVHTRSPFPYDRSINKKVVLWAGDICCLNAHAIVHPTNESLSDQSPLSERLHACAGSELAQELKYSVRVCKTGDAKITRGYNLPARYIIHSVGPRYNIRYQTAAQSALYSCYRKTLLLAREYQLPTIAFSVINSSRRGYPPEEGAHIALRTVRRFLEKCGSAIELVVFVVEDIDVGIYELLLPLYFPRNAEEEEFACYNLPQDIGNEDGEPFIADRQIRIMEKPHLSPEELEESTELLANCNVGASDFAKMKEDVDARRGNARRLTIEDELTIEAQGISRYERLLRRARTEDLSEIARTGCFYQSGVDKLGRPVIVFVGKWFRFDEVNLEKALLYLIYTLFTVVKQDYVIIYFHTATTPENRPSMQWIKDVYNVLEYKYKKNLKAFYVVHPTFWTKLMTWWFTTFMATSIKEKLQNIAGLEYLYSFMDMSQLQIPTFIREYDMTINGIRYYTPEENSEED